MEVFAGVLGYESAWLGAIGWVAVCSNLAPRLSTEMFHAAAFEKDMDKALALYRRLAPLLPWVGGPRYVSGTKAGFRLMGMDMGDPRPPRLPLPAADMPALGAGAARHGADRKARAGRVRKRQGDIDHASSASRCAIAARSPHPPSRRPPPARRACRIPSWSSRHAGDVHQPDAAAAAVRRRAGPAAGHALSSSARRSRAGSA
jgi:hypothetical protein